MILKNHFLLGNIVNVPFWGPEHASPPHRVPGFSEIVLEPLLVRLWIGVVFGDPTWGI